MKKYIYIIIIQIDYVDIFFEIIKTLKIYRLDKTVFELFKIIQIRYIND